MIESKQFNPGDKVELKNEPGFYYDFGYYSAVEGKAVIYEPGCRNAQDSYAVSLKDLSKAPPEPDKKCGHCSCEE